MKRNKSKLLSMCVLASFLLFSCTSGSDTNTGGTSDEAVAASDGGQSTVEDDVSQKDILKIAVGSPDHTTLVTAVKAAGLADALANAGPFTVFAPTNAAFDALPKGTVEALLKPEKKADLEDILQYHVYIGKLDISMFSDGQVLGEANGGKINIGVKDGKVTVNGANIIASVPASNGIVHVIDAVLLPPSGK